MNPTLSLTRKVENMGYVTGENIVDPLEETN